MFLLSLGIAAGLHGAALAYALTVHEAASPEVVEDVVTVEIVDASMLPDESEPSPPTDKLPSAAASGAQHVALAEPQIEPVRDTSVPDESVPQAAAPDLGEAEDGRSPGTSEDRAQDEPGAPLNAAKAPSDAAPTTSDEPVADRIAPQAPEVAEALPPAASAIPSQFAIVMEAPPEDKAVVAVSAPLTSIAPSEVPTPEVRVPDVPLNGSVKPARPPQPAAKAVKRPLVKRIASLEPVRPIAPSAARSKRKQRAEAKTEKAAKPKARKLAALPSPGSTNASTGKAKAKAKAKAKTAIEGKAKGKGARGTTASGSTGLGSYTNTVRARVARNKPSGTSGRGTAVVQVAVSMSGGIRFVRLKSSSGNASLDRAAISAVQRAAPFPAPPSGATSAQLVINIPITYR